VDVFVVRYDLDGNHVWTRQFGTDRTDSGQGIAVDDSGVYVSGKTGRPPRPDKHWRCGRIHPQVRPRW
jgi:hypothetical protein